MSSQFNINDETALGRGDGARSTRATSPYPRPSSSWRLPTAPTTPVYGASLQPGRALASRNWRVRADPEPPVPSPSSGPAVFPPPAAPITESRAASSTNWRQPDDNTADSSGHGRSASHSSSSSARRQGPRPFVPMDIIQHGRTVNAGITAEERRWRGFSENYAGDPFNVNNRPANIPSSESTSLYLENLPVNTTHKSLLDALTAYGPWGKVNSLTIAPPDPSRGHHFAAAKLAMFTRHEAECLLAYIKAGNFVMDGQEVWGRWNRLHVAEFHRTHPGRTFMSRAIIISGPADMVSVERLYPFFASKFQFATQDVLLLQETATTRRIKWIFSSIPAQSQAAHLSLKEEDWDDVGVHFGADPMDDCPSSFTEQGPSLLHLVPELSNFASRERTEPEVDRDQAAELGSDEHQVDGCGGHVLNDEDNEDADDEGGEYEEENSAESSFFH